MIRPYTLVIIRYYTLIIVTYSDNDTDVHTDNGNGKRIIERITTLNYSVPKREEGLRQ